MANQHTFAIVFVIKLQHQADSERKSEKQEEAEERASVDQLNIFIANVFGFASLHNVRNGRREGRKKKKKRKEGN